MAPQPKKRPKSSYIRFQAEQRNLAIRRSPAAYGRFVQVWDDTSYGDGDGDQADLFEAEAAGDALEEAEAEGYGELYAQHRDTPSRYPFMIRDP
ncbi:hypothetical protein AB0E69_33550 [Kribbella sp. NPDC026611]|uniref:hypothetical protein n=1 Tax=Kribbella sp. NPDC026611 TaxID=3154911 RepID=UPI0033E787FE